LRRHGRDGYSLRRLRSIMKTTNKAMTMTKPMNMVGSFDAPG